MRRGPWRVNMSAGRMELWSWRNLTVIMKHAPTMRHVWSIRKQQSGKIRGRMHKGSLCRPLTASGTEVTEASGPERGSEDGWACCNKKTGRPDTSWSPALLKRKAAYPVLQSRCRPRCKCTGSWARLFSKGKAPAGWPEGWSPVVWQSNGPRRADIQNWTGCSLHCRHPHIVSYGCGNPEWAGNCPEHLLSAVFFSYFEALFPECQKQVPFHVLRPAGTTVRYHVRFP